MALKKWVICLFAVIISVAVTAQEVSFNDICKQLSRYEYTTGSFVQKKTMNKINRTLTSSGTFLISKNEGFVWNTKKPFASVMVISPQGMQQKSSSGQAMISGQNNDTFAHVYNTIASVFSGNETLLQQLFTIEYTYQADTHHWTATLTPKDSTIASFMAYIKITGSTSSEGTIETLTLNEISGGTISYKFLDQTHPETLRDEQKEYFSLS